MTADPAPSSGLWAKLQDAARRQPRHTLITSCLAVMLVAWAGTVFFADQMLTALPEHTGPTSPRALTQEEIVAQIREAQEINERLRSERAAARAYAFELEAEAESLRAIERAGEGDEFLGPGLGDDLAGTGPGGGAGALPAPGEFVATDTQAEPTYTVRPTYPDLAMQSGTEGTVVVQALVGADGSVRDTRILRSIPFLNSAAETAVRQWRFTPAMSGGRPVATWVSIPITFRR